MYKVNEGTTEDTNTSCQFLLPLYRVLQHFCHIKNTHINFSRRSFIFPPFRKPAVVFNQPLLASNFDGGFQEFCYLI